MSIPLNASYRYTNNPVELSRYNMIEQQIRPWQVYDAGVLELLGQVRREDFVPPAYRGMAFTDMEIPLRGEPDEAVRKGECMLTPKVEARLLQDLVVQPHERVLEIGAGSGFMAALLARSAKQVVTLEIEPELAEMARTLQTLQRRSVAAILGSGLLVVAAVLYALEAGGPRLLGVPLSAWVAGLGGLWAILAALPRK